MMATRLNSKPAAALTTISKRKMELPLSLSLSSSSEKDDKKKRAKRDMSKPGAFSVPHVCEIGCEHSVAMPTEQPAGLFDYTAYPYKLAVQNIEKVRALLGEATIAYASLNGAHDGGTLLRQLGERVFQLTDLRDASFFGTLLPPGTRALYVRALCPLREKTLEDGAETLSGGVIHAYAKALDLHIVVSNIAMHCWRQGKDGVEPGHGQAGCHDLHGKDLEVCTLVKELHFLGILAAGIIPVAVLSSSNCAMESFGSSPKEVVHFEPQAKFHGLDVYFVYHLKYASHRCLLNSSVALAFECTRSEVPARYVDGFARMGARILGKTGDEALEKQIYESMRGNEDADLCLPAFEDRMKSEMTPAYKEKLLQHRKLWGYSKEGWATAEQGRYRKTWENSLKLYAEYRYTEAMHKGVLAGGISAAGWVNAEKDLYREPHEDAMALYGQPRITLAQHLGVLAGGISAAGWVNAEKGLYREPHEDAMALYGQPRITLAQHQKPNGLMAYIDRRHAIAVVAAAENRDLATKRLAYEASLPARKKHADAVAVAAVVWAKSCATGRDRIPDVFLSPTAENIEEIWGEDGRRNNLKTMVLYVTVAGGTHFKAMLADVIKTQPTLVVTYASARGLPRWIAAAQSFIL